MTKEEELSHLRKLCSDAFESHDEGYSARSAPWSAWADQKPKLVLEPHDLPTLQSLVRYLYSSSLDFCIRNTGTGSVSAADVCVSTHGFKSFGFDPDTETVTIGAGFSWGEVDALMEAHAPGYAVLSARCPWVGVTGSALVGGMSWLSHEFGLMSDPQNLLDMQVVLRDGRVVWAAAEDPDLMWALRGGGGNFGVVTALKLRARRYPTQIFCGIVFVPYSSLRACSHGVAAMQTRPADPRVAMHVFNQGPGMGQSDQGPQPGLAIMMYDAHGEAHARSEDGFAWALQLPGANPVGVGVYTLRQIHAVAETFRDYQGKNMFWASAPLLCDLDEDTVVRAWKWYEDSLKLHAGFGIGSTVGLEFMQPATMSSSGSRTATAWPHSEQRHVMQLVLGCEPEGAPKNIRDIAMKQLAKAEAQIAVDKATGEYHVGFLHEWNDLSAIYGENYARLRELKKVYDPENRFKGGVDLA